MMGAMTTVDRGNRLVGRTAALAATGAALSDAEAGVGGLLLVTGEPGIGKSALLAEQARRAAAWQLRVVRGAGYAEAGAPPYWLWTQVLRGLPAARLGDAARLLDRANVGEVPHPPEARFRLFDAVREVLVAAAPCWSSSMTCTGPTPSRCACWSSCTTRSPRSRSCCWAPTATVRLGPTCWPRWPARPASRSRVSTPARWPH